VPENTYRRTADRISTILGRLGGPDLSSRPGLHGHAAGADYGTQQGAGIRRFNEILAGIAASRGVRVVDLHDLSLAAASDPSLVARDGLHPSGTQYARWVERILPVVEVILGR
jgi:lysophospholipase L1-like esterase